MPILGLLSIAFQVFFAVHAVKTGRERWLFIIIFFPVVGCLVYFFVEYLPDLRRGKAVRNAAAGIVKAVDPGRELRRLRDQLELTDSIKNRKALAEGCVNAGLLGEAISLYKSCLKGAHADDPSIMEGLCLAYFFSEDYEAAKMHLLKLREIKGDNQSHNFNLLLARTHEELGDKKKALEEYAHLVKHFTGEEAQYRYALLLKRCGETEKAKRIFQKIVKEARLAPKYYRKAQRKWINLARREA